MSSSWIDLREGGGRGWVLFLTLHISPLTLLFFSVFFSLTH